jgi:ATP/maltotriose-dependent transcriptional regulator MalT
VLLATKLHLPRTRPGFVARPGTDRLAPSPGGELTLVCAPAGFGKTVLVADWARRHPRPAAWLSLDEGDNDPARSITSPPRASKAGRPTLATQRNPSVDRRRGPSHLGCPVLVGAAA